MKSGADMSPKKRLRYLQMIRIVLQDSRTARKRVEEVGSRANSALENYCAINRTMQDFPDCLRSHFAPEVNGWARLYYGQH